MRNIPSQVVFVVLAMITVCVTNLIPREAPSGQSSQWSQQSDGIYMPPIVPSGNQTGFIMILQIDRRDVQNATQFSKTTSPATIAECVQSYNSIADQIDSEVLSKHDLPVSLN